MCWATFWALFSKTHLVTLKIIAPLFAIEMRLIEKSGIFAEKILISKFLI
jgi:hypothetical protein